MTISGKTAEQIYLEWINDFLTVKKLAEYYNMPEKDLMLILNEGKRIHNQ